MPCAEPFHVGELYPTWFSDKPDGMSTILGIFPYSGKYQFTHVLRLSAPRTYQGYLEMAVHSSHTAIS